MLMMKSQILEFVDFTKAQKSRYLKFKLDFDSYKSSTNKNHIQIDQLKTIKRTKSRLKRIIKML